MQKSTFISATEIAEILQISPYHAYRIIEQLNQQIPENYILLENKTYRELFENSIFKYNRKEETTNG